MNVSELIAAVGVLEPLVEDLIKYWHGGAKPKWFEVLPEVSKSRATYEALVRAKTQTS